MSEKAKRMRPLAFDLSCLPPEALDVVDQLLTHYMQAAHRAYTSAAYAAKIEEEGDAFKQQAVYWKAAHGGLRWARGSFRRTRQAHERRATPDGSAGAGGAGDEVHPGDAGAAGG